MGAGVDEESQEGRNVCGGGGVGVDGGADAGVAGAIVPLDMLFFGCRWDEKGVKEERAGGGCKSFGLLPSI